jgi:hypothetical protein
MWNHSLRHSEAFSHATLAKNMLRAFRWPMFATQAQNSSPPEDSEETQTLDAGALALAMVPPPCTRSSRTNRKPPARHRRNTSNNRPGRKNRRWLSPLNHR